MKKSYELISLWLVHNFFLGLKYAVWVTCQQKNAYNPRHFWDMPLSLSPPPLPLQAIKPPPTTWAMASSSPPVWSKQPPWFWGQEHALLIFIIVFFRPWRHRQNHRHHRPLLCSVPIGTKPNHSIITGICPPFFHPSPHPHPLPSFIFGISSQVKKIINFFESLFCTSICCIWY